MCNTIKFNKKSVIFKEEQTDAVTAVVHGVILGVPVAFQLPNPDGCKDSGLECPLTAGKSYHYQATLPVLKKYPKVIIFILTIKTLL